MAKKNIVVSSIDDVTKKIGEITPESINAKRSHRYSIDLRDTSIYDENTWYPVSSGGLPYDANYYRMQVEASLASSGTPNYAIHDAGFTACFDALVQNKAYGANRGTMIVLNQDHLFVSDDKSPISGIITSTYYVVLYLRGGGSYNITTDFQTKWTIHTKGEYIYSGTTDYVYPIDHPYAISDYNLGQLHTGLTVQDFLYISAKNSIGGIKIGEDISEKSNSNYWPASIWYYKYSGIGGRFEISVDSNVRLWLEHSNNDTANLSPYCGNMKMSLGNSTYKWEQLYANTSTISTSDRNKKKDISYMGEETSIDTELSDDILVQFIMSLKPCVYRFIENDSNRPHHGMISQDIEEIIQSGLIPDHAGFIKSPKVIMVQETDEDGNNNPTEHEEIVEGEYEYSLRYEEFIPDVIHFCQILKNENIELKKENQDLKTRLDQLEEKINSLLK